MSSNWRWTESADMYGGGVTGRAVEVDDDDDEDDVEEADDGDGGGESSSFAGRGGGRSRTPGISSVISFVLFSIRSSCVSMRPFWPVRACSWPISQLSSLWRSAARTPTLAPVEEYDGTLEDGIEVDGALVDGSDGIEDGGGGEGYGTGFLLLHELSELGAEWCELGGLGLGGAGGG